MKLFNHTEHGDWLLTTEKQELLMIETVRQTLEGKSGVFGICMKM